MNKKYRLKREYPGSPKLGDEVIQCVNKDYYGRAVNTFGEIHKSYIENQPEFWEEVIEQQYEILSFYAKNICGLGDTHVDKDYIWLPVKTGVNKWSRDGWMTSPYTTEQILNNPDYGIYSVKRLSDGEVFTIGDKVRDTLTDDLTNKKIQEINYFQMTENTTNGKCLTICFKSGTTAGIRSIFKSKQPLFTTEDGVDKYLGDKYWTLRTRDNNWLFEDDAVRNVNYYYGSDKNYSRETGIYYFSTKEASEEYILMNKPCLSLGEVIASGHACGCLTRIKKLKELVKSKLK